MEQFKLAGVSDATSRDARVGDPPILKPHVSVVFDRRNWI